MLPDMLVARESRLSQQQATHRQNVATNDIAQSSVEMPNGLPFQPIEILRGRLDPLHDSRGQRIEALEVLGCLGPTRRRGLSLARCGDQLLQRPQLAARR